MMALGRCKERRFLYLVGFGLYCLVLVLFVCSIAIPGIWLYDRHRVRHSDYTRLSIWDLSYLTCLESYSKNASSAWRCEYFGRSHALREKTIAVSMLMAGVVIYLVACLLLTSQTVHIPGLSSQNPSLLPETAAGCAVVLCLGGVLMTVRYTYYAVNLQYGPGVSLQFVACVLGYVALLFTAFNKPPPARIKHSVLPQQLPVRVYPAEL